MQAPLRLLPRLLLPGLAVLLVVLVALVELLVVLVALLVLVVLEVLEVRQVLEVPVLVCPILPRRAQWLRSRPPKNLLGQTCRAVLRWSILTTTATPLSLNFRPWWKCMPASCVLISHVALPWKVIPMHVAVANTTWHLDKGAPRPSAVP